MTRPLTPLKGIVGRILLIRGQRVMLDVDLADSYGVATKRLNEQIKRNSKRFPPDFMFQVTSNEMAEVVASCDHLHRLEVTICDLRQRDGG